MCGIVGMFAKYGGTADPNRLAAMTAALAHRGPDGQGTWISGCGQVGFGHTRLAILDLSPAGAQPMLSHSGRYALTFNGEIYNFNELRKELQAEGAFFCGHSDTEVILAAFERWGVEQSLPRLRGMFAIGVWDTLTRTLSLARDRLGIKPLYYSAGPGSVCFASQLRSVTVGMDRVPPVCPQAFGEYLRLGYVPSPLSILTDIVKLPSGCLVEFQAAMTSPPKPYWDLSQVVQAGRYDQYLDEEEAVRALEAELNSSIASHMVSDVPLGALLSGGIDSSLVVALMQGLSSRPVKTFSIGFHEQGYNEAVHAAAVARHLGTEHTELYVTEADAQAAIPMLPDIYDEPFADQSQIPTYLVSKLAREQVTVALSGDGGDELFAGYNRYDFVETFWCRLRRIPLPLRRFVASCLKSISPSQWDRGFAAAEPFLPARLSPALPGQKMHKVASILHSDSLLALHSRLVSQWANPEDILLPAWSVYRPYCPATLPDNHNLAMAEQQMLWDMQSYLPDDILTKVDRASMRVGLEVRVPLLDHRVVELAWRIPIAMKLRREGTKWPLRQILYRHVPRELVERPKMGFSIPVDAWLRGAVRPWAEHCLDRTRLVNEGYFQANAVLKAWESHQRGAANLGGALWTVLMFQSWQEMVRTWA